MDGSRTHNQQRVRDAVSRVVKEAVDRTNPRSARRVGELLFELGYSSPKNPGEPYSDSSVRAWLNQRDRPLADVILALILHHDLPVEDYLWGVERPLRAEVQELKELVVQLVHYTGFHRAAREEEATAGS